MQVADGFDQRFLLALPQPFTITFRVPVTRPWVKYNLVVISRVA
jgi:hypothetical protein